MLSACCTQFCQSVDNCSISLESHLNAEYSQVVAEIIGEMIGV